MIKKQALRVYSEKEKFKDRIANWIGLDRRSNLNKNILLRSDRIEIFFLDRAIPSAMFYTIAIINEFY